jgi:hypothetical protein
MTVLKPGDQRTYLGPDYPRIEGTNQRSEHDRAYTIAAVELFRITAHSSTHCWHGTPEQFSRDFLHIPPVFFLP